MNHLEESLKMHEQVRGKIEISSKVPLRDKNDLSLAYTPGVAAPCLEIQKDMEKSYDLTWRWNTVAVITDGTAVLGLGDIGPEAGMPVMEGKCVLFKEFAGIDAIPLCIRSKETEKIVETIRLLAGSFGGINLEDISAPRCFEIERRLKEVCDIPVFHDDQHGTAVVVLAALINALKVSGKSKDNIRVVVSGAGAAGCAVTRLLLHYGVQDISMCDIDGAVYEGRENLNEELASMARMTNPLNRRGSLCDLLPGSDVLIGLSAPNLLHAADIRSMNREPIVFSLANPTPEIFPDEAKAGGAVIVATGRSDYPNQINNVLAFPGIFRGALDVRASDINEKMKVAAAYALADTLNETELSVDSILPNPLDKRVAISIASAVSLAAKDCGLARRKSGAEEPPFRCRGRA